MSSRKLTVAYYVTGMTVKNPKPDRERIIFETVARHGYEPQSEEEFFNCVIALESELVKLDCYVHVRP
jgi:hypothetical protein